LTDNTNPKPPTRDALFYIFVAAILCGVGVIIIYRYNFQGDFSVTQGDWGSFGDFVGGTLNPLFSLFALLALLITIRLQNDALRMSQKALEVNQHELSLSREEMALTRLELEGSKEALNKQNFESSFFNMLKAFRDIAKDVQRSEAQGNEALRLYSKVLLRHIAESQTADEVIATVNDRLFAVQYALSNYFKSLEVLLNYVDTASEINSAFYIEIIESQLNSPEITLLFCYGLLEHNPHVKNIIERYSLLYNFELKTEYMERFDTDKEIAKMYDKNAYTMSAHIPKTPSTP